VSSGFPFPVPWSYIPANIYLIFRLIYTVLSSSDLKQLNVYRKKFHLTSTLPALDPYHSDVHYLCPATPSTDFPFSIIPDNITPCGPILLSAAAVEESDPPLAAWLGNGPTVMVNLGTHALTDKTFAFQLASGLRMLSGARARSGQWASKDRGLARGRPSSGSAPS